MVSRSNSVAIGVSAFLYAQPQFEILQQDAARSVAPAGFYWVEAALTQNEGTEEERFSLLKTLIHNPFWRGHTKISVETWEAFVLSLPKDGGEDEECFEHMPEDIWSILIWELGRNKEEFDLTGRLGEFNFAQHLFSDFKPEELLTLVRAHHTEEDLDFWEDVFQLFSIRKWRDLVIALSESQLAELLFYKENELFPSPIKRLDPQAFDTFNDVSQLVYDLAGLIRAQCEISEKDEQTDILTKLKLFGQSVNHYVESYEELKQKFEIVLPIVKGFSLFHILKKFHELKEGIAFGLTLSEENKEKIDALLDIISPAFHFNLRVVFNDHPTSAFMFEFDGERTKLRDCLRTYLERNPIPEETMQQYMDEDAEVADLVKFMQGTCDEPGFVSEGRRRPLSADDSPAGISAAKWKRQRGDDAGGGDSGGGGALWV